MGPHLCCLKPAELSDAADRSGGSSAQEAPFAKLGSSTPPDGVTGPERTLALYRTKAIRLPVDAAHAMTRGGRT